MKHFFFNPNDYGREYSVMSDSNELALNALKDYLLKKGHKRMLEGRSTAMGIYNEWKDATVDSLPEEYSIDVFEKDVVVETYNG